MNSYTYVSKESVDGQLRIINMLLDDKNYKGVCKTLGTLISNINNAVIYECDKDTLFHIVDEAFRSQVDMAFKRYNQVHDRVRDMHYMVNTNKFIPKRLESR